MLQALGQFFQPQNLGQITSVFGNLGAAISPQDSWQQKLGGTMANMGQGLQYANTVNAQRGAMQPPQPQSMTVKFAAPVGTPGSQMDAGAGGQPQPNVGNTMAPTAPMPQGTGMPQFNPTQQQQQPLMAPSMIQTAFPQMMANGGQAASPFGVAQLLQSLFPWGK